MHWGFVFSCSVVLASAAATNDSVSLLQSRATMIQENERAQATCGELIATGQCYFKDIPNGIKGTGVTLTYPGGYDHATGYGIRATNAQDCAAKLAPLVGTDLCPNTHFFTLHSAGMCECWRRPQRSDCDEYKQGHGWNTYSFAGCAIPAPAPKPPPSAGLACGDKIADGQCYHNPFPTSPNQGKVYAHEGRNLCQGTSCDVEECAIRVAAIAGTEICPNTNTFIYSHRYYTCMCLWRWDECDGYTEPGNWGTYSLAGGKGGLCGGTTTTTTTTTTTRTTTTTTTQAVPTLGPLGQDCAPGEILTYTQCWEVMRSGIGGYTWPQQENTQQWDLPVLQDNYAIEGCSFRKAQYDSTSDPYNRKGIYYNPFKTKGNVGDYNAICAPNGGRTQQKIDYPVDPMPEITLNPTGVQCDSILTMDQCIRATSDPTIGAANAPKIPVVQTEAGQFGCYKNTNNNWVYYNPKDGYKASEGIVDHTDLAQYICGATTATTTTAAATTTTTTTTAELCIGGVQAGDGFSRDKSIGGASSLEECVSLCKAAEPDSNAAVMFKGTCRCEYESCGIGNPTGGWDSAQLCLFKEVSVDALDASGCSGGWVAGASSHGGRIGATGNAEFGVPMGTAGSAEECLAIVKAQKGDVANGVTYLASQSKCQANMNQSTFMPPVSKAPGGGGLEFPGGWESAKSCFFGYWCGWGAVQQAGPTAATTTTTTDPSAPAWTCNQKSDIGVCLDGLDEIETPEEITCEVEDRRECKGWCYSKKHKNKPWKTRKCEWYACAACPECATPVPTSAPTPGKVCRKSCHRGEYIKKKACQREKCADCCECTGECEPKRRPPRPKKCLDKCYRKTKGNREVRNKNDMKKHMCHKNKCGACPECQPSPVPSATCDGSCYTAKGALDPSKQCGKQKCSGCAECTSASLFLEEEEEEEDDDDDDDDDEEEEDDADAADDDDAALPEKLLRVVKKEELLHEQVEHLQEELRRVQANRIDAVH